MNQVPNSPLVAGNTPAYHCHPDQHTLVEVESEKNTRVVAGNVAGNIGGLVGSGSKRHFVVAVLVVVRQASGVVVGVLLP